jgi:hypothetical protein
MAGFVEGIFLAPEAGAQMKSVQAATALEGCGLDGDRYCAQTGHWSRFGRVCEVTGVGVKNGEHRRNVVTRGISLKALRRGERFGVGEVVFEYRGPRSVCRYIERLTEPGMTQALKGRGGICARVIENGTVRVSDERRTPRGVGQHALECHIGMRGYALYPAASSACAGTLYPSRQSSTAYGSERTGRGHGVVAVEV